MTLKLGITEPAPKMGPCRGLVFRLRKNVYWDGNSYNENTQMYLLKKKSCTDENCFSCMALREELHKRACDSNYRPIINMHVPGGLYELQVTNISRDWESGVVDDWDLEFTYIKEEEK